MIRGKLSQIFAESITKLNKIIFHLDRQLGVASDFGQSAAFNINPSSLMMCHKTNQETPKHQETENIKPNSETKTEEKPKKENKKNNKKAPEENDLFQECDLRVGRVKEISTPENLNDCYYLKVDLGEENLREIGTGLKKFVGQEEFANKLIIIFANLKPKKLNTFFSNGMVLCAFDDEEKNFELIRPHESKFIFTNLK
jgi:methionine--tRNA ligase beta chain